MVPQLLRDVITVAEDKVPVVSGRTIARVELLKRVITGAIAAAGYNFGSERQIARVELVERIVTGAVAAAGYNLGSEHTMVEVVARIITGRDVCCRRDEAV